MDLIDIAKSQVGGKYIPITAMTGKQRKQLVHKVTASRMSREYKGERPFMRNKQTTRTRRLSETLNRELRREKPRSYSDAGPGKAFSRSPGMSLTEVRGSPEDVSSIQEAMRRQKVRRTIGVTSPTSWGTILHPHILAVTSTGTKGFSNITRLSGEPMTRQTAAHEVAHAAPKRKTVWRAQQIGESPRKVAREEARADAVARRTTGTANKSGYEADAAMDERVNRVAGRIRRVPLIGRRASKTYRSIENIGRNVLTEPQTRAYRDVRRKTGTWP